MDQTPGAPNGNVGQPAPERGSMTALVQDAYGAPSEVLRLARIPVPRVGAEQVLIRVRASSANPSDWHFIRGEPVLMRPAGIGGIRRPRFRTPGGDVSGIVEQAGPRVPGFAPGDEVFGFGHGAFAEYLAVPHSRIARKPRNLTFQQAAAVPLGAITALQGLRAGHLQAGQRVLIIGASGGVGTFAVQIAKHLGAQVTGVCSTRHIDLVRRLGAEHVLDYTEQDITAGDERYDLVLQLGGTYPPAAIRRVLTRKGTLIQSFGDGGRWLGPLVPLLTAVVVSPFVSQTLKSFTAQETTQALDEIRELVEAGHLEPVIDSSYPLAEAAAAVEAVEQGSPGGKITVIIE